MTLKAFALLLCASAVWAADDEYQAEALSEEAPKEVADAIRKELTATASRVAKDKKPFVDVWLRKAVPTGTSQGQIGVQYGELAPGTLVGVLRVHGNGADYRGQKVSAGLYTLRYALQPEDGDHQGTSETRDYLLLAPVAADTAAAAIAPEEAVKLSTKVTGKKHPAVLYLVKGEEGGKLPRVIHDSEKDRRILECETRKNADGKALRFWIVVAGKAPE